MNLSIENIAWKEPKTEVVERKGLGHPDTICDALAEEVSIALSKYYLENFGTILHHNVDKGLLIGGEATPEFGGGEVISPIRIIIAGRAVKEFQGKQIPVDEIAREAVFNYLERFNGLDLETDVELGVSIRPGSADLVSLMHRREIPLANDTSFGVGFWPLDRLETIVLETEKTLNSKGTHGKLPWLGEDIKVMGLKSGEEFTLTIASAQIGKHVKDLENYVKNKEKVKGIAERVAKRHGIEAGVHVNTSDDLETGTVYLTVTGLSAEAGDDGEVGRGNRANGLITPYRPMSLEALAGKNPVNHVGKIYNILANRIARHIIELGADYASVVLLSQIGKPINEPLAVDIKTSLKNKTNQAIDLVKNELENISNITWEVLEKKTSLY